MWRNLTSFYRHPPSFSVGLAFAIMSLLFGAWITRIPDIQLQSQLSEGELGLALLGMPIGAVAIMPFLGKIISRWGTGKVTFYSALGYCLAMVLPAFSYNLWSLSLILIIVGVSAGAMDVAMNAAAAHIEKRDRRAIMSTCHAFFSFGGMIGAGLASLIAGWGVPVLSHLALMAGSMLILAFYLKRQWLQITQQSGGSHHWAWPGRSLIVLAIIGFCVLLAEGAIADWSAVYLKNTLKGSGFISGLGFAGFSMTMAWGRLYGDILIPSWGGKKLVIGGGLLAAVALLVALIAGNTWAAILGFTMVGLGFSCIVPIIFSAAANVPGVTPGGGIAAIASMGYIGFMVGPPAIGFLAEAYGLAYGLGFVALMALIIAVLGTKMPGRN